ncbi:MAG: DUF4190 domain-containing protein [Phycisphaerae bacterium]|nr:DUF4190 domain-containing protein [Phycisphaerae bacterium]
MGLASLSGYWPFLFLPAIICGVAALLKINRSNGILKGKGLAITGIAVPSIIGVILAAVLPTLITHRNVIVCSSNLSGLNTALIVYAAIENEGIIPNADVWCDVLVSEADVSPKSFICPSSDAVEGQSSYAINRNAAGKRLRDLPADMVLLFEVSPGPRRWNPSGGPESITTEHHRGKGCNVLFAGGSIRIVPAARIHTLRWTPD